MQPIAQSARLKVIEQKWRTPIRELFHRWHWDENLKHGEIGKRVGMPRPTITRWFHELNIPSQPCTRFTNLNLWSFRPDERPKAKPKVKKEFPWKVNQQFFQNWSEEMAYILGFFVADGNLTVNPRGSKYIEFTSCDRPIIEKIRDAMGSNHKIGEKLKSRDLSKNLSDCYRLQIGSRRLFSDLFALGMTVCKSLVVQLPVIPQEYFAHFLRGYFDGDGHVVVSEYCKKGRKRMSRVLVSGFTSGGIKILEQVFSTLQRYAVVEGGSIHQSEGFHLRFSVNDSIRLHTYMYSKMKTDLFLSRKKTVFDQFIKIRGPVD